VNSLSGELEIDRDGFLDARQAKFYYGLHGHVARRQFSPKYRPSHRTLAFLAGARDASFDYTRGNA
jgi:hypothetical protein